jgi:hypothetical protein
MSLIIVSGSIIPPPEGADVTTTEGLKAAMPLFETKHFIFPFLAHALGTLVGAFIASLIAATHKLKFAFAIGFFFLLGGIASVFYVAVTNMVYRFRFRCCVSSNGLFWWKISEWKEIIFFISLLKILLNNLLFFFSQIIQKRCCNRTMIFAF